MMSRRALALGAALLLGGLTVGASPAARPQSVPVVPSLEPRATDAIWQRLVEHPRRARVQSSCRPLRGIFYAATDWLRLATKLAATASPCASYYVSIPPVVGDKTTFRKDQAWRIRALGSNFHALAEFHWTTWSRWVADTGSSWYEAGVEARRRMAEAGFDVGAGDAWAVNEFPSSTRSGVGSARGNARELVRGLYEGDGGRTARGVVFVVGIGQSTTNVTVYQANLQNWLADQAFWQDMTAYVSDWSQEVYGDFRRYAVPGAPIQLRRDYLNDYLQHALVVTRAGPPTVALARSHLETAFSPIANAAWQYETGYGWTMVPFEQMQAFVSAQVYALRSFTAATGRPEDRFGFAWQPRNASGLSAGDFANQTGAVLDRLSAAIRDSADTGDPADPGSGACGPPGQNLYCGGDYTGAQFAEPWKAFRSWSEPVLAYTTPAQTTTAGEPSSAIGLGLTTTAGTPYPATTPLTVKLASTSPQGRFSLSPAGPWTSTLSVSIPAGQSSAQLFHYSDTRAATPEIAATAVGATSATQVLTVEPGPPARLALAPTSATLQPYGSQRFSASAQDAFGNPVSSVSPQWSVRPGGLGATRPPAGPATTLVAGGRGGIGRLVAAVDGEAGQLSGLARLRVEPGPIRVAWIRYETRSGVLRVTANVTEARGAPARAVLASVVVRRGGRTVLSARKRTDGAGRATFLAPLVNGCYRTTVTGLRAPGYRWNGTTPANRFCSSRP